MRNAREKFNKLRTCGDLTRYVEALTYSEVRALRQGMAITELYTGLTMRQEMLLGMLTNKQEKMEGK